MSEKEIIEGLVDLVQSWMNGLFKESGITWEKEENYPPALRKALEYLREQNE